MVRRANGPLYCSLLSFSALGMLFLSYSADLIMLFVAWELMSLPTYALAGFDKQREESNEASAKYAILGALSSAILLYAISLSYGLAGSTLIVHVVRAMAGASSSNPITLAHRPPLHRRLRVQDVHRALPHVGPGHIRGRPHHDQHPLRRGDEEGRFHRSDTRACSQLRPSTW